MHQNPPGFLYVQETATFTDEDDGSIPPKYAHWSNMKYYHEFERRKVNSDLSISAYLKSHTTLAWGNVETVEGGGIPFSTSTESQ